MLPRKHGRYPASVMDPSGTGQPRNGDPKPSRPHNSILLLAGALIAFTLLYQGLKGNTPASGDAPPRFTVLAEPRRLPTIVFVDGAGQSIGLEHFRGKVVLLNIWATWCPPCRKEMPSLDRLQARLGSKDFEVVALSIDKGEKSVEAVKSFYSSLRLGHLQIYNDPEGAAGFDLGVVGVPATLLLDREGREIGRMSGAAAWDSPEAIAAISRHIGAPASR